MVQERQQNYQNSKNTHRHTQVNMNEDNRRGASRLLRVKDPFKKALLSLVEQIENIYKLDAPTTTDMGDRVKDLDIVELNRHMLSVVKNLSSSVRRERNLKVAGVMASFIYLSEIIEISGDLRVSFVDHPGICQLASSLGKIVGKDDNRNDNKHKKDFLVNRQVKVYLVEILTSLEIYEKGHGLRKNMQLNYRLLRLIYILLLYGNRLDALLLANFCANQVRISLTIKRNELYNKHRNNFKSTKKVREEEPKSKYYTDGFNYTLDLHEQDNNYNNYSNNYNNNTEYSSVNSNTQRRKRRRPSTDTTTRVRNQTANNQKGGINPNEPNRKYKRVDTSNRKRS